MTTSPPTQSGGLLLRLSMMLFAAGLVALAAIFVCFALGKHDLPLWLNLAGTVLTPLGLALGLISVFRVAKRR